MVPHGAAYDVNEPLADHSVDTVIILSRRKFVLLFVKRIVREYTRDKFLGSWNRRQWDMPLVENCTVCRILTEAKYSVV